MGIIGQGYFSLRVIFGISLARISSTVSASTVTLQHQGCSFPLVQEESTPASSQAELSVWRASNGSKSQGLVCQTVRLLRQSFRRSFQRDTSDDLSEKKIIASFLYQYIKFSISRWVSYRSRWLNIYHSYLYMKWRLWCLILWPYDTLVIWGLGFWDILFCRVWAKVGSVYHKQCTIILSGLGFKCLPMLTYKETLILCFLKICASDSCHMYWL